MNHAIPAIFMRTACGLLFGFVVSLAQATIVFTDRGTFVTAVNALGISTASDSYETYSQGSLTNGQRLGAFSYTFDSTTTQAGIAADGASGQALGDTSLGTDPNAGSGVFVGGETVILTHTGSSLLAFGIDFSYAPAFESLLGNLYQLRVRDGSAVGATVGNLGGLDASGGSFFLGIIEDLGSSFTEISIESVASATDPSGNPFIVPAYQVDNLIFGQANTVPEPETLTLSVLAVTVMALVSRRRRRRSS